MIDILKRLEREAASREEGYGILYDAIDEIAQLRENIKLLDGLWHEYHDAYVLQVEENDRLKNDLEAMGMDADMQARDAGNMEYNARVLMAERDQERADREEWMRQHAALDALCTRREDERDRLQKIVQDLLSVMPVLPAAAKHIVGMEDRYNSAITNARTALGKDRQ